MENFSFSYYCPDMTIAIIKPDGMKYKNEIIEKIHKAGFQIIQSETVRLSIEKATEFFKNRMEDPLKLTTFTQEPLHVMSLGKKNAILDWLLIMGPEDIKEAKRHCPDSLRGLYGNANQLYKNVVHGSQNEEDARHEIRFFFPNIIIDPIMPRKELGSYLQRFIFPTLMTGLSKSDEFVLQDPYLSFAEWLLINNHCKPIISKNICHTDDQN